MASLGPGAGHRRVQFSRRRLRKGVDELDFARTAECRCVSPSEKTSLNPGERLVEVIGESEDALMEKWILLAMALVAQRGHHRGRRGDPRFPPGGERPAGPDHGRQEPAPEDAPARPQRTARAPAARPPAAPGRPARTRTRRTTSSASVSTVTRSPGTTTPTGRCRLNGRCMT